MDTHDPEELARAKEEGFPCAEADRVEDLAARLGDFCGELGLTALHLRSKARMRHNSQQRALATGRERAAAQKRDASQRELRSA